MIFNNSNDPRGREFGLPHIAVVLFFLLVIADLLMYRAWQGQFFIKGASYAIRVLVSAFSLILVAVYFLRLRSVPLILLPLVIYCAVVASWFAIWIFSKNSPISWAVVMLNPSFSVLTWLLVLWISVSALTSVGNAILYYSVGAVSWIALLGLVLATAIEIQSAVGLYLPTLSVLVLFAATVKTTKSGSDFAYSLLGPLAVFYCMAITGYRTYMLAALLVWPLRLFLPKISRHRIGWIVVGFIAVPFLYAWLVSSSVLDSFLGAAEFTVDTRLFLFHELWDDYTAWDLLLGRGLDGTYYSPYFYVLTKTQDILEADYYIRSGSEVGWLNVIIKLGFVGLFAFMVQFFVSLWTASQKVAVQDEIRLGVIRYVLLMLFIFCIELPASITAPYVLWYVAIGSLMWRGTVSRPWLG